MLATRGGVGNWKDLPPAAVFLLYHGIMNSSDECLLHCCCLWCAGSVAGGCWGPGMKGTDSGQTTWMWIQPPSLRSSVTYWRSIMCEVCVLSPTLVTPWTIAHQALLSMGFSRQECWSGLPCPSPGDLPDPGIKLMSLAFPASADGFFTTVSPGKPKDLLY